MVHRSHNEGVESTRGETLHLHSRFCLTFGHDDVGIAGFRLRLNKICKNRQDFENIRIQRIVDDGAVVLVLLLMKVPFHERVTVPPQ